jgi:hypothetical protein
MKKLSEFGKRNRRGCVSGKKKKIRVQMLPRQAIYMALELLKFLKFYLCRYMYIPRSSLARYGSYPARIRTPASEVLVCYLLVRNLGIWHVIARCGTIRRGGKMLDLLLLLGTSTSAMMKRETVPLTYNVELVCNIGGLNIGTSVRHENHRGAGQESLAFMLPCIRHIRSTY